ncbi:MAG: NAD(P)H-hydrate epimerase, partial [Anaerolineae bacterium]
MRLLSVAEMRALEAGADAAGHTYARMMAQAGAAVALAIEEREPIEGRAIVVLVGPGNNGGDGLVVARLLQERGAKVIAYLSAARDVASDDVFREAIAAGVEVMIDDQDSLRRAIPQADVLIDALLGTGAAPPLRGAVAEILQTVRAALVPARHTLTPVKVAVPLWRHRPCIVAVDGPSGLDFDTGEIDPLALDASLTVTFAAPKWGHVRLPGAAKVGELLVADIGIPESVAVPAGPTLATPDVVAEWLPPRPAGANKGTFGKAMVVAGSSNYTGAAVLSASAALRAGAGLVTLALPGNLHPAVVAAVPEATYVLLPHTLGVVNEHAVPVLRDSLEGYTALLIGP